MSYGNKKKIVVKHLLEKRQSKIKSFIFFLEYGDIIADIVDLMNLCNEGKRSEIITKIEQIREKYYNYHDLLMPAINQYVLIKGSIPLKVCLIGQNGVGRSTILKKLFDVETNTFPNEYHVLKDAFFNYRSISINSTYSKTDFDIFTYSHINEKQGIENILEKKDLVEESSVIMAIVDASSRSELARFENVIGPLLLSNPSLSKRMVIILNKIDLIPIQDAKPWNLDANSPTKECMIQVREILKRLHSSLEKYNIKEDQLTYCSAIRKYNLDDILDKCIKASGEMLVIPLIGYSASPDNNQIPDF
jgi:tRNA U34 5-carboxymethylaminomethyl modifying GTPase MnmE/TrmE